MHLCSWRQHIVRTWTKLPQVNRSSRMTQRAELPGHRGSYFPQPGPHLVWDRRLSLDPTWIHQTGSGETTRQDLWFHEGAMETRLVRGLGHHMFWWTDHVSSKQRHHRSWRSGEATCCAEDNTCLKISQTNFHPDCCRNKLSVRTCWHCWKNLVCVSGLWLKNDDYNELVPDAGVQVLQFNDGMRLEFLWEQCCPLLTSRWYFFIVILSCSCGCNCFYSGVYWT